ncbi:MAG: hypothetical protein Q9169_001406 [Polycauliona sp. 2 TL-2023]
MATSIRLDGNFGYAGVHSSIAEVIYFLNHLEIVSTDTAKKMGVVCVICQGCHSDLEADSTWHQFVRLPSCSHVFGRSCLFGWLTPFDRQQQKVELDDDEEEEEEDDDDVGEEDVADLESGQGNESSSGSSSGWTAVNNQPTTTDDSNDNGRDGSSEAEERGNHDRQESNEVYTEEHREGDEDQNCEDESSDDSEDEVMADATHSDHEGTDPQNDHDNDSGDENNGDGMDVVMGEAGDGTGNNQHSTQLASTSLRTGSTNEKSEWLAENKVVHIDNTMSEMYFRIQFPVPCDRSTESRSYAFGNFFRAGTDRGLGLLEPGHNTCPCCRNEQFARPAVVDSLVYLATRIRVWDTAYAFLGLERNAEEDFLRDQCLQFMGNYLIQRSHQGERVSVDSVTQLFLALKDASRSLVLTTMVPPRRSVCRSIFDRARLSAFGEAMRYRPKDLKVWYSGDAFKVWYGPEDPLVRSVIHVELLGAWSGNKDSVYPSRSYT